MLATLFEGPASALGGHGDDLDLVQQALPGLPELDDLRHDVRGHGIAAVGVHALLHHVPGGFLPGEALPGRLGECLYRFLVAVLTVALLLDADALLGLLAVLRAAVALLFRDQGLDLLDLPGKALGLVGQGLRLVQLPGLYGLLGLLDLPLVLSQQVIQFLLQIHCSVPPQQI